jgi:transcription-repair coupling factor (superfamily II helicase)
MGEDELEEAMLEFYEHKFDVLVLYRPSSSPPRHSERQHDPIDDADRLGLAPVVPNSGGVSGGRGAGYATVMYRKNKMLLDRRRAAARGAPEFSELGSGYKIALRTWSCAARATCSARSSPAPSRRWASTCTRSFWSRR